MKDDDDRAFWAMFRWSPNGGYLPLIARAMVWPRPRQAWYQFRLRWGGRLAPAKDLQLMLEAGGWRTSLAATWLIAAGRREDLRPAIERDMLAGLTGGHGWGYCTSLACLGTESDAQMLVRYLDHALTLPVEREGFETQCQGTALATLMYLDEQLGTTHAQRFLGEGGPWERWPGSADRDLAAYADGIRSDVVFAAGGNPGIRRQLKEADEPTGPGPFWRRRHNGGSGRG
ncbi:DUF6000 family protein [Kribbella sp. NPDC003557]|uniref:DUF6000 family protein n=1 Tax=Kribbella sp. NPDC003557 TaxID=3154449 RepID=UPI0033A4450B